MVVEHIAQQLDYHFWNDSVRIARSDVSLWSMHSQSV